MIGSGRSRSSAKRWLKKMLLASSVALLLFAVASCAAPVIAPETDVVWLERGQEAPWSGFLLTKRMIILMYEDAAWQESEETVKELRERYGQ